jgi:hypothetical protein
MQLPSIKAQEKQELEAAQTAKLKQQVPFTADNVTNYLIRFIAVNDQVNFTLITLDFI